MLFSTQPANKRPTSAARGRWKLQRNAKRRDRAANGFCSSKAPVAPAAPHSWLVEWPPALVHEVNAAEPQMLRRMEKTALSTPENLEDWQHEIAETFWKCDMSFMVYIIPLISQKKQLRLITVYIGIQSSDNSVQPSYCCLLGWLSHLIIDHRTRLYSIISSCHPLMGQFNTLSPKNMGTLPILITWWMMRPEKWHLPSINHHSFLSTYTSTVTANLLPTCTITNLIVPFYLFLFTTHLHPRIHQPWLHDSSFPICFQSTTSFSHHFPIIFPSFYYGKSPSSKPQIFAQGATAETPRPLPRAVGRRWPNRRSAAPRRGGAAGRWPGPAGHGGSSGRSRPDDGGKSPWFVPSGYVKIAIENGHL